MVNTNLLSDSERKIKNSKGDLSKIISSIFSYNELRRFVDYHLDTDPEAISIPDDKNDFIYDMLSYFQRRRELNNVVVGLRQWRPNNSALYAYSIEIGLAAKLISPEISNFNLEAIISDETGICNLTQWQLKLGKIENQICIVKLKKYGSSELTSNGTGFLIGNDLVLTNWHVVSHLIDTNGKASSIESDSISVHFGFFAELDANREKTETTYSLDRFSWLVAHSLPLLR